MSIWVEQLRKDPGSDIKYANMVADSLDELHEAAEAAGVPAEQFSGHDGSAKVRPHYRLTAEQRAAVTAQTVVNVIGVGHLYVNG